MIRNFPLVFESPLRVCSRGFNCLSIGIGYLPFERWIFPWFVTSLWLSKVVFVSVFSWGVLTFMSVLCLLKILFESSFVGCLPMVRDVPLVRESRFRVSCHGFFSRSYRFFVSQKIVFVFGFMCCPPMIRNVPLVLGSRLRICFRRLSFHSYRFFVSLKIVIMVGLWVVFSWLGTSHWCSKVVFVIVFVGCPFSRFDP